MSASATEPTSVLLVGASGMLGGKIAAALSAMPQVQLRLLARPDSMQDPRRRAAFTALAARGGSIVEGDLAQPATLDAATTGVEVVISAIQGAREVIVDGQVALAKVAARNGVRRILPSDFALDIFKAPPGEHLYFDLRREADDLIAATGIESIHVLNGAFMDSFVDAFFDHRKRIATYWGSGEERFDATTVDDAARYTARAALDTTLHSGKLAVAAEQLSFGHMVDTVDAVTGHTYARRSLGSIDDLRQAIVDTRRHDSDPAAPVMLVYMLFMLTGQTALDDLQNARHPDIGPELFADVATRTLGARLPHAVG